MLTSQFKIYPSTYYHITTQPLPPLYDLDNLPLFHTIFNTTHDTSHDPHTLIPLRDHHSTTLLRPRPSCAHTYAPSPTTPRHSPRTYALTHDTTRPRSPLPTPTPSLDNPLDLRHTTTLPTTYNYKPSSITPRYSPRLALRNHSSTPTHHSIYFLDTRALARYFATLSTTHAFTNPLRHSRHALPRHSALAYNSLDILRQALALRSATLPTTYTPSPANTFRSTAAISGRSIRQFDRYGKSS